MGFYQVYIREEIAQQAFKGWCISACGFRSGSVLLLHAHVIAPNLMCMCGKFTECDFEVVLADAPAFVGSLHTLILGFYVT
jgi:hypothetical protein